MSEAVQVGLLSLAILMIVATIIVWIVDSWRTAVTVFFGVIVVMAGCVGILYLAAWMLNIEIDWSQS